MKILYSYWKSVETEQQVAPIKKTKNTIIWTPIIVLKILWHLKSENNEDKF